MKFYFILFGFVSIVFCSFSQNSSTSFGYDSIGQLIQSHYLNGIEITYSYDALGNRLSKTISQPKTLAVNIFLEGLFNSNTHQLNKAQDSEGDAFEGQIADSITVELHQASAPYAKVGKSYRAALLINGQASFVLGSGTTGQFYLVVKHRNSIETWSASPVNLVPGLNTYDFTDTPTAAYGQNLKNLNGYYCIFGGDVNQDGAVNMLDIQQAYLAASNFSQGYFSQDANGDGTIDALDLILIDNNSANEVSVKAP